MNKLDQFYTKPEIAKRFIDRINCIVDLNEYDNIIEPSAGSGNILELLPKHNRIGLDLDPKHPEVLPMDFFDYDFPKGKNITIGNPPFGFKSKLAIQFFNKCAKYSEVIAFIIPRSWMRFGIHNKLNKDFKLLWNCVLPDESFIFNNKPYKVKCVAQLWSKEFIKSEFCGYESWNNDFKLLKELDIYQLKNNCYERPKTLF